jgi:DNA-binding response OmpR family regulator/SAM-dependent methyltransferase
MRLLIVEDNQELSGLLMKGLAAAGFAADVMETAASASAALETTRFAAVILDLGLPDADGLSVLRELRQRHDPTPVLVLSARGGVRDRVEALRNGADDYLVKPFAFEELVARLEALLRRPGSAVGLLLHLGNVTLDTEGRQVFVDERPQRFSAREVATLEILIRRSGRVVAARHVADHLFGPSAGVGSNAVEVHVYRLRKQLPEVGAKVQIRTVRGVGYLASLAAPEGAHASRSDRNCHRWYDPLARLEFFEERCGSGTSRSLAVRHDQAQGSGTKFRRSVDHSTSRAARKLEIGMSSLDTVVTEHFGSIPVRHRNCPLCRRNNDRAAASGHSHGPWVVKQCPDCGFVYIENAPQYESQFEMMAWERTTKIEQERRAELRPLSYNASKRSRVRLQLLPKRTMRGYIAAQIDSGNVLDLGCGGGQAMESFPPSFRPFGIEISSEAAATADHAFRARGGYVINSACVDGLRGFPDGFFAAASLRSYLEHEADPLPVLENLRRVLAPFGFAVVKVPNYGSLNRRVMGRGWCGFRYPEHLNYFTPKTLRTMAARAGYEIGFGLSGRLPTSDNMWAVLTKCF